MEVRAVPSPRIARPDRVATAPTVAALVVPHMRGHVVVDRSRLAHRSGLAAGRLERHLSDSSVDRDEAVGLAKAVEQLRERTVARCSGVTGRLVHDLVPLDIEGLRDRELTLCWRLGPKVED